MTKYRGYEIVIVTESYLKCYGGVLFSLPEKPGAYAIDTNDAKRKIDDEIWEEEKRYTD